MVRIMQLNLLHLYFCSACKKKFRFKNIKYAQDGKTVLCTECYEDSIKKEQKKKDIEATQTREAEKEDVIRIICVGCRYKFSYRRGSRVRLMCPYCSGNNLIRDETTADRLVEEASRNIDVY